MLDTTTLHITKTSGVCGGKACIAGHRIRVIDIMTHHEQLGESAKDILSQFPGITLADVYAALTYYYDRREEIEEEMRRDSESAEEYRRLFTSKLKKQKYSPSR